MYVLYMIRDTIHYTVQATFIPRIVQKLRQNSHNYFLILGLQDFFLDAKGCIYVLPGHS